MTYTPIEINTAAATGALIGSYLPDMDIKHSKAGKVLPAWLFIKHRGPTHSLFTLAILTVGTMAFNIYLGLGLGFGYGMHLLSDALTPMHLPYWNWHPGKKNKAFNNLIK
jgi:membrane-bound metal-dependent hydrolase YbcI (DUF457 family)